MKSHFQFTNQQRNGIFLLLAIVLTLQCVYWFIPFDSGITDIENIENTNKIKGFKKEIDSLRLIEIENKKPKIYPFNPNYITDYKGYTLGMSIAEIDRLHKAA